MSRIRTIKPEFFRHEELQKAEVVSGFPLRLAFAGLWTVADREGLFKWKPSQIKLDIFPFDDLDIVNVLDTLRYYGFIIKYSKDNKDYGFIPTFKDHQVINSREAASKIPKPDASLQLHVTTMTRDGNAYGEGKGREGNTYTRVAESLCGVFHKTYKEPQERFPAEATFYKDIDTQAELIAQVYGEDESVVQVKAYMQYCKMNDRKVIGTAYKLSETILSSNWVKMLNPEARGPDSPFRDAEENKKVWTDQAWKKHYWPQISDNPEFKKHFGL